MNQFFRSFFAALLALFVFSAIFLFFFIILIAVVAPSRDVEVGKKGVIVVDLQTRFGELQENDAFAKITGEEQDPSLYHLTRLLRHAAGDESISGILLKCENNANDFAASEEIRDAILDFRKSGKFVIAAANSIPQRAYYVATAAEKIYCTPAGGLEWHGFAMTVPYLKGTLEKLEIQPQIFYAGEFKSVAETFRETAMTDANRLQNVELLGDLYAHFLQGVSDTRKIDTATLRRLADSADVQFPEVAVRTRMIDGVKFDDEVKDEIRKHLKLDKDDKINFLTPGKYSNAVEYLPSAANKIAVIYAEGTIIDGESAREQIGGDTYRRLIRKAREEKGVKAIVLRINSGGGSAVASEVMWREVVLARSAKPVIVSFGDVAASGGYYMACGADSIFAEANSITGSIGVFGLVPNMEGFFNNKLGITFDEVKTSPNAGLVTVTKPLSPAQRQYLQRSVDTMYMQFKQRVASGRSRAAGYIDSVAQGRVWSGSRALQIGLIDRIGGLDDAIRSAANKAGLKDFGIKEYPDKPGFLEVLKGKSTPSKETIIRRELGDDGYKAFVMLRDFRNMLGTVQARMPFEIIIE